MILTTFQSIFRNFLGISPVLSLFYISMADCNAQYRPSLFFREDWKENPAATHVTQEHVSNNDLILGLYGPGCDSLRKSHHPAPVDDPFYIWSGLCRGNWAVTLKNKNSFADLTGNAKILWRSKQFNIMDISWYVLNIRNISEMKPAANVDLSRVGEIGFTDLMTGGGTVACSRLDWIEVYAKPVR